MRGLVLVAVVLVLTIVGFGVAAAPADAHRNWCHTKHVCPSDHATYRWGPQRLLCVATYSDKRNASFKMRVYNNGRMYLCKR